MSRSVTLITPSELRSALQEQKGGGVAGLPDINGDGLDEMMVRASYTISGGGGATAYRTYIFAGGNGVYISSLEGDATYRGGETMSGTLQSCYGDITGPAGEVDGWVNISDLLLVINTWGQCSPLPDPCPADIAPRPMAW